jgi:hypothetical protein
MHSLIEYSKMNLGQINRANGMVAVGETKPGNRSGQRAVRGLAQ